jgi:hypothetical protein
MPSGNCANDVLQQLRKVITPLHVRPLVNEDSIEIRRAERGEEPWRERNDRRAETEYRGVPDTVRDDDARRTAGRVHATSAKGLSVAWALPTLPSRAWIHDSTMNRTA